MGLSNIKQNCAVGHQTQAVRQENGLWSLLHFLVTVWSLWQVQWVKVKPKSWSLKMTIKASGHVPYKNSRNTEKHRSLLH